MSIVLKLVLIVQLLSAVAMIILILIQHGKGADMGAAFGSGTSGSLFGASGSANFMSRATSALAAVFFVCTLALSYFGNLRPTSSGSVLDGAGLVAPVPAVPAAPAGSAGQIPGNTPAVAPAVAPAAAPATPAAPASPATSSTAPAQIPVPVPTVTSGSTPAVDASKPATQIPTK
jgi:preprotein translocase subunit SecG